MKGQYVYFPFSETVERAGFHDIHTDVDSVVSKNLAVRTSEFVSQHTVYKLMNVWSDLKHFRTHEYVSEPLVDAVK